jgi:hypothetical protein
MSDSVFMGDALDNPSNVDDAFRGAKAPAYWLGLGCTSCPALARVAA